MPKQCGFCGGPGVSKEHLWPDWVLKIVRETRGSEGKEFTVEHERHGKVNRFKSVKLETTIGMPCEECNNGWMSVLENSVKPFMAGMVFPGQLTLLSEERRRSVARWVVKTAMVYEFFKPDGRFYFTPDERREFMNSSQPANDVYVWLAKYDATQPMHASADRKLHNTIDTIDFYSLTLTANFFAVQVVASRERGPVRKVPVAEMPKGALLRIWPASGDPDGLMEWPPPIMMGPRGLVVLDTRFREGEARQWSKEQLEN